MTKLWIQVMVEKSAQVPQCDRISLSPLLVCEVGTVDIRDRSGHHRATSCSRLTGMMQLKMLYFETVVQRSNRSLRAADWVAGAD